MALSVVHSTVATLPDEPGAEINKAEWNAAHTITGAGTMATQDASAVAMRFVHELGHAMGATHE